MKKPSPPIARLRSLSLLLLCSGSLSLHAQTVWQGVNNGDWSTPANWSAGAPGATTAVQFHGGSGGANVQITDDTAAALSISVGRGRSVTLTLADGAALTAGNQSNIGHNIGPSSSQASVLRIEGPSGEGESAAVSLGALVVGSSSVSPDGNSVVFSGSGLTVLEAGTNPGFSIGRFKNGNFAEILAGATVYRSNSYVGYATSSDNRVTVSGAGSRLINNGNFVIGTNSTGATSYANGMTENRLEVQAGGSFEVIGSSALFYVGARNYAHSNGVSITGIGSKFIATDALIQIGDNGATNAGGNYFEVRNGGTAETSGNVEVYGYATDRTNDGANFIAIGDGGSFTQTAGSTTIHSDGLLVLEENGSWDGTAITIASGAGMEAAGDGLTLSDRLLVESGGNFAVSADTGAFTLATAMTLEGEITFTLVSESDAPLFLLDAEGALELSDATLRLEFDGYTPVSGDRWVLFDGVTANIDGSFAHWFAPELEGGLSWSFADFNEAGGWQVAVIPEPSAVGLIVLASGLLWGFHRRMR